MGQCLGGQHVLDLRGADTKGQRAEGAVRGGMRVTADDGHPRLRRALLRADDMHDALARIAQAEQANAVLIAVPEQCIHLGTRNGIGNTAIAVDGRYVVIGHGKIGIHAPDRAIGQGQPFESLGRGDFVHHVTVDIQQAIAVFFANQVFVEQFFVKRLCHDRLRISGWRTA